MSLKNFIKITLVALAITGCKDSTSEDILSPEDVFNTANIYPVPPNQWIQSEKPMYISGFVGDVMPYYENGSYHLFFLYDALSKPSGQGYHDIHSFQTSDFVNYQYQGQAIPYGNASQPDFAVGTGATVKAGDTYYFYYTGHNANDSFLKNNPRESILLATSKDLKTWTKNSSFKMTAPAGYYDFEYRDPHVFYNDQDGKYWMLVSAQTDSRKAVLLKYTSANPATGQWNMEGALYTTTPDENYVMLECPDLFRIGNYWYLLFSENWSSNPGTHYRISTSPNGPWTTPKSDRIDGQYYYAAKTAGDAANRYIFGWTARKDPQSNQGTKNWGGNLVAHKLLQNTDGTLATSPIAAMKDLYATAAPFTQKGTEGSVTSSGSSFTLNPKSAIQFDRLQKTTKITTNLTIPSNGSAAIILGADAPVKIAFERNKGRLAAYLKTNTTETLINEVPYDFGNSDTHTITMLLNNDVCVVYVDDKIAFSNRVYTSSNKPWELVSDQGTVVFTNLEIKIP